MYAFMRLPVMLAQKNRNADAVNNALPRSTTITGPIICIIIMKGMPGM